MNELIGECPNCEAGLDGGRIPENQRSLFGAGRFSRAIAVYDREKDRTVKWQCPDCGHEWRADDLRLK